jgi:ABC-2 type transport system ATP-binding protein
MHNSYTREMVRQDILSRKPSCSVLISTHHIDDVEVISDRVWFLNDHSLVFDGPLSGLKESFRSGDGSKAQTPPGGHLDFVDFSTSNAAIKEKFLGHFSHLAELKSDHCPHVSTNHSTTTSTTSSSSSSSTWGVELSDSNIKNEFFMFLRNDLEGCGLLDWSVSSPNVYDSLSQLYAPPPPPSSGDEWEDAGGGSGDDGDGDAAGGGRQTDITENYNTSCAFSLHQTCVNLISQLHLFCQKLWLIIGLRLAEMKLKKRHFLFSSIILPFCMMLLLVFYCRDIRYPKMELNSSSIGGIGEILVSYGARKDPPLAETPLETSFSDSPAPVPVPLQRLFGQSLTWLGYHVKSNKLFDILYKQYYTHPQDRWSSFVIDDTVENWVQSSVRITDRSFTGSLTMRDAFATVNALQISVCNASSQAGGASSNISSSHSAQQGTTILSKVQSAFERKSLEGHDDWNITEFCQFITNMDIGMVLNTSSSSSPKGNVAKNLSALVMHVSQSLNAKITMLSNMTFFHDTPMFLKEVVPYIYASRDQTCPTNSSTASETELDSWMQDINTTKNVYTLFSHPFDDLLSKKKSISPAFIQRGYLGSVIIIMYILLTSTSVLKFITQCKANGIKTQLHLSGISPLAYWTANFIVDFGLLFLSFLSIFTAIALGGPPISSFYLDSKSEYANVFLFSLCSYASSSVAANYFFAFLSVDQVSSQLFALFSSLCGGLFLRLFIALHAHVEPYVTIHNWCLWISPSYAFSSNMYNLLVQYIRHFNPKVSSVIPEDVSLFTPLLAMCCQTIAYLVLTVLADMYYYRFTCWLHCASEQVVVFLTNCRSPGAYEWQLLTRRHSISLRSTVLRYIALARSDGRNDISAEEMGYGREGEGGGEKASLLGTLSSRREEGEGKGYDTVTPSPSSPPPAAACEQWSTLERSSSFLSEHSVDGGETSSLQSSPPRPQSPSSLTAAPNEIVSSNDLNIAYSTGTLTHSSPIIKNLTMHIERADRVALMGVNGGGKSTLYRAMTNTEMLPLSGSLLVGGFDTVREHWQLGAGNVVGYVPQEGGLVEFMTVEAAVDLFIRLRRTTLLSSLKLTSRSASSLAQVLDRKETRMRQRMYKILPIRYFPYYIFSLSGGNKQKLAILLSNIYNPSLLLLDEPTSGIDPPAAHELIRYLSSLPASQAMIFASHRMEECLVICRRVLLLFGGRLQFDGPISEFAKVTDLFYQVDVEIEDECFQSYVSASTDFNSKARMSTFVEVFLNKLQLAVSIGSSGDSSGSDGGSRIFVERIVRYSNSLVRFTFEKTKCPLSVMWNVLTEWNTQCHTPQQQTQSHTQTQTQIQTPSLIRSMSLRKMSMEEIFAAMVDSAKKTNST